MMRRGHLAIPPAILALVASFGIAAAPAHAGDWIADRISGCKVWNPNPSGGEAVSWSGACAGGFAEGRGVLAWLKSGKPYERDEGEWRDGKQMGGGSQTWPGGTYKGGLRDGLPHGEGTLTSGASRYSGTFRNGKPDGTGTLTNPSGTFQGEWRDGCFKDGARRASFGIALQACP